MRDAAVERLAKIISDSSGSSGDSGDADGEGGWHSRRSHIELHVNLEEGWFSLFLLAAVVYSTIWCIQAVRWVDNINILSLTTAAGLIVGVLAAKQQRFPRLAVHIAVICFGIILAYWQTAGAFYSGSVVALEQGIHRWFSIISVGGTGDDDAIFLLFILALGFILAYTSAWLVYRTRSPWLMIVANAVVLLINLSNVSDGYVFFLVIFLIASLLLLLRFNLHESLKRWRKQGLRYADDIGWDVMQAGALISIAILVLSWILPYGYKSDAAATIWTVNSNPWVQFQSTWNRVISVDGGANPANHGNFRDTLVLGGNPNLNQDIVLTVKTDDSSPQYLSFVGYDTYANHQWIIGPTENFAVKVNDTLPASIALSRAVKQTIHVVNPPGEQNPYILGASAISSMSLPADVVINSASGNVVAWVGKNGFLTAGADYTVSSLVSSADVQSLRSVPLPKDSPPLPDIPDEPAPTSYFSPTMTSVYTQLPSDFDPRIKVLAQNVVKTAHATNMYDMAAALENYLRSHYQYSVDIHPPSDADGISWFLFDNKKGFCNYFASSMALMARSLGLPARIVAGYTAGKLDAKTHQYVIRGADAHAWTQVYFAGYGWVNFEPSASFDTFTRPLPNQFVSTSTASASSGGASVVPPSRLRRDLTPDDTGSFSSTELTPQQAQAQLRQRVGMAIGSLILLVIFGCIVFGVWWRRLFRRYTLASQLYGRICLLAKWAGIEIVPSQTPYEYLQVVAISAPEEAETLEHLGDIYVRERWADPQSEEHPSRSGEINELAGIWKRLQPRLFFYVLRHPHFLRWLPERIGDIFAHIWRKVRSQKLPEEEF